MNINLPVFDHGTIKEVFPDIFFVTSANIFEYEANVIQKSNNMIIVRDAKNLTLINTLGLNDEGLKTLDKLGTVTHVIRSGAFHDRYDILYLNRYKAKLWALSGMTHNHNRKVDFLIGETDKIPFPDASFFKFETTAHPEAIVHINRLGGILICCDSIKNWSHVDEYFSEKTGKEFLEQGLIKPLSIDKIWLGAMSPKFSDFARLKKLHFRHLMSAHGEPHFD